LIINGGEKTGEVFKDKLLGALEKRWLSKFLQSAVDWGRIHLDDADALTLNEKLLALGEVFQSNLASMRLNVVTLSILHFNVHCVTEKKYPWQLLLSLCFRHLPFMI
jgi:hypothetical protein